MPILAAIVIAGVFFVADMGRTVLRELEQVSTAQNDDVSWRLSQLEVELQNVRYAAKVASQDDGGPDALRNFRLRYNIFYSRVATLMEGSLLTHIRETPEIQPLLADVRGFLNKTTPVVDGSDQDLRAYMREIVADVDALHPKVRTLSLTGIQSFAKQSAAMRAQFFMTLLKLAGAVVVLLAFLLAAVGVLIKLFRQVQSSARAHQAMSARFEAAVSSSLDAVLLVDTAGRITEFNGAAEAVFGYTRDEAIGGQMAEMIIPEEMRQAHQHGMERYLKSGQKTVIGAGRIRLEARRKSGERFPVELTVSVSEADGERIFVSFVRDITPEVQAEEDLRTARDTARQSEKAKSDLLTVMSHEMRTPLNGILGSLALIETDNLNDRQKRHLNSIAVSGELLLTHVNDVLDLSSLESRPAESEDVDFDMVAMVTAITDSLSAYATRRGNDLKATFLSEGLDRVRGNKTAIQQCLVNLVGNAIKFTRSGSVEIEVECQGGMMELRVSDTGRGISPENISRIFEEFVTIDASYDRENSGTGLGLAITKRLVESMGGEIHVDSILGEGSLFTIRVPVSPQKAPAVGGAQAQQALSRDVIPPGYRVLVVDDNQINRMILSDILQEHGAEVTEAADGFEAIGLVGERPFDLAFLDISMPGIDGMETLHRIRALDVEWRDLQAVAVTANALPRDHQTILTAPFDSILVKPIEMSRLFEVLRRVAGKSAPAADAAAADDPAHSFIARFGHDRYRAALNDLAGELEKLARDMDDSPDLSEALRAQSHRLAGSAAVLGEDKLYRRLQTIEHLSGETWSDQREGTIRALGEQAHALKGE
ncbi:PAS domain-containing hybrid sensor histidine kinase/response regulator [Frigidibacter sp. SD6-1]|uniref:hybrid sensor histidine kinase/response regulator n=2 Tax=Frigidibacter sp. SD6-1 TaxID=3032581 RepID=UPI0024DF8792|nr:PAS domain-containing hybrid sensor histidine kinase/response regulator [Frigidibacter sp. SD6-1]